MPQVRNGDFQIVDLSGTLELVPRVDSLVTNMNLFTTHMGVTTVAQVERVKEVEFAIQAKQRGGERQFVDAETADLKNFNVPFFPLDRTITPADVQNFRKYFTAEAPRTVQDVVTRCVARIRRDHAQLREVALINAIMGKSYAPGDSNCQYNYFTVFGVEQVVANIAFTDAAVDPMAVLEEKGRASIIDNAGDNAGSYELVVLASRKWFSALIAHPMIRTAYQYYASNQEPLRRRLGGNNINRVFEHGGVTFIEDISGIIPAGEAYMMPRGISEMFQLHYAPADTVVDANTPAQELYIWYKYSSFFRTEKIETETSFLAINTRPELVIKLTGTFE